jgi:hypothetical protein
MIAVGAIAAHTRYSGASIGAVDAFGGMEPMLTRRRRGRLTRPG